MEICLAGTISRVAGEDMVKCTHRSLPSMPRYAHAFLDAQAIHEAWECHCFKGLFPIGVRTMRRTFSSQPTNQLHEA